MNTPHHQTKIHHTPYDRHNPGGRLPNDRYNPGGCLSDDRHTPNSRLSDDRHNPEDRLPDDRHYLGGRLPDDHHNPGGHLPAVRHYPNGRRPDDRHYPSGRLPDDHHNPGGRLPNDNHYPGVCISNDRQNPDGRLPNDRHFPGGRLPGDRHNPGGHEDGPQVTGHHNAHYNKHHVKESLTTRVTKLICAVFLCILFTVGLATFILWLSLRPHRPRFHIQEFSIPNLADPNGYSTARITFNVTARNPNIDIGIYYDKMNLTIYYKDQTIAESPLLFPFYQSPKNTAIIYGTLTGPALRINRARWMQLLAARKREAESFRVDVESSIRFKVSAGDSRHHKMHANCELGVGLDGMILASDKEKKCPVYFS